MYEDAGTNHLSVIKEKHKEKKREEQSVCVFCVCVFMKAGAGNTSSDPKPYLHSACVLKNNISVKLFVSMVNI